MLFKIGRNFKEAKFCCWPTLWRGKGIDVCTVYQTFGKWFIIQLLCHSSQWTQYPKEKLPAKFPRYVVFIWYVIFMCLITSYMVVNFISYTLISYNVLNNSLHWIIFLKSPTFKPVSYNLQWIKAILNWSELSSPYSRIIF